MIAAMTAHATAPRQNHDRRERQPGRDKDIEELIERDRRPTPHQTPAAMEMGPDRPGQQQTELHRHDLPQARADRRKGEVEGS
jgi:hypothetical protein